MRLRKLENKDAEYMLEWMHDDSVVKYMRTNFENKTLMDCEKFIDSAQGVEDGLHMAIVDDFDEYMGTVSLKNIKNGNAEFAITVRKKAMGKGFSRWGMAEIIRIGMEDFKLRNIYWCVSAANERAVKFYDKNGYKRISIIGTEMYSDILMTGSYTDEQVGSYIWYAVCGERECDEKSCKKNN